MRCRASFGSACAASLLPLLALLAADCGPRGASEAKREALPPPVEALRARSGRIPGQETVNGTVRARNQVAIRPEVTAAVAEVRVVNGEAVAPGQVLVRLVDDELAERLRQAEAALRVAEAETAEARASADAAAAQASRVGQLAEHDLVSQLELETQRARVAAAEARTRQSEARVSQARSTVEERRAALSRALVRAPVAGRVGRREVEVGQLVTPNTVLCIVGDPDEVIVEVPLTEEALLVVGEGSPVLIRPRGGAEREPIGGSLTRISPFLRPESFSTVGEIDVDNRDGRLLPGMFVSVHLLHDETAQATSIPAAAVWEDPRSGEPAAWVVVEAGPLREDARELSAETLTVERRPLTLLGEGGGLVGVEGIEPGEWVVTVGQHLLHAADGRGGQAPSGRVEARVRPVDWQRVLDLQGLQREDLLRRFLQKQRIVRGAIGSAVPASPDVVDRLVSQPEGGTAAETPAGRPLRIGPAAAGAERP